MHDYTICWIGEPGFETVQAGSAYEAWVKFKRTHPNFKDDEGDTYVTIVSGTDGLRLAEWEAGYNKAGLEFFRSFASPQPF